MKPLGVFEYTDLLEAQLRHLGVTTTQRVALMRAAREWRAVGATPSEASEWIVHCKLTPEQAKPLIEQDVTPMQWLAGQPD